MKPTVLDVAYTLHKLIELAVVELVDDPDQVSVDFEYMESRDIIFTVTPHPSEVGKVLGKKGAHFRSLKTLAEAIATKYRCRVTIIVDDKGAGNE